MKTYIIDGKKFEYDGMPCLDFFIDEKGCGQLHNVPWDDILLKMQENEFKPADLTHDLIMLDRWHTGVPRKRMYRKLVLDGVAVLSGEYWFDNLPDAEAEDIFTKLLNSAVVARRFLEMFLPEVAKQCKQKNHPAQQHYIDP